MAAQKGNTPLINAAKDGQTECVEVLLQAPASVAPRGVGVAVCIVWAELGKCSACDTALQDGWTAKDRARHGSHRACVELLDIPDIEGLKDLLRSHNVMDKYWMAAKWCKGQNVESLAELKNEVIANKFARHLGLPDIIERRIFSQLKDGYKVREKHELPDSPPMPRQFSLGVGQVVSSGAELSGGGGYDESLEDLLSRLELGHLLPTLRANDITTVRPARGRLMPPVMSV